MLLLRHSSFRLFLGKAHAPYFGFAMLMGILWMASFLLYGVGARALGHLGLSLGWGVFMCTVVAAANAVGILNGEWRLAPATAKTSARDRSVHSRRRNVRVCIFNAMMRKPCASPCPDFHEKV